MSQPRHTMDQIVAKLRRADVELGKGKTVPGACKVLGVLQYLFAVRGRPEHIRSRPTLRVGARGPEFVAKAVRRWLAQAEVGTLSIAKGSPWENGYVESAGGKLRDELLNRELCLSLQEACWVIDRWRLDYNHYRIHSALNYQTPAAYAAPLCSSSFGYASASRT